MRHDTTSPFEEQVARTLEGAALAPPPGLANRVARALETRQRPEPGPRARRRWAAPAALAVLTAIAVTAGAVMRGDLPGATTSPAGAGPSQAVGTRVLAAFTENAGQVVHIHQTYTTGAQQQSLDVWSSPAGPQAGDEVRTRTFEPGARDIEVVYTEPAAARSGSSPGAEVTGERIYVDYSSRTWSDQNGTRVGAAPPGPTPETIRSSLSAGRFRVVGPVSLDGRHAIELVRTYDGGKHVDDRLWVDPETYLPLREVVTGPVQTIQVDFQFVPPTEANLGQLQPVVPAGFDQVSAPIRTP